MELSWGRDAVGLEFALMCEGELGCGLLTLPWLSDGGDEEDVLLLVEDVGGEEESEDKEESSAPVCHLLMDIQTI